MTADVIKHSVLTQHKANEYIYYKPHILFCIQPNSISINKSDMHSTPNYIKY